MSNRIQQKNMKLIEKTQIKFIWITCSFFNRSANWVNSYNSIKNLFSVKEQQELSRCYLVLMMLVFLFFTSQAVAFQQFCCVWSEKNCILFADWKIHNFKVNGAENSRILTFILMLVSGKSIKYTCYCDARSGMKKTCLFICRAQNQLNFSCWNENNSLNISFYRAASKVFSLHRFEKVENIDATENTVSYKQQISIHNALKDACRKYRLVISNKWKHFFLALFLVIRIIRKCMLIDMN